jgi:hypothetical protein
MFSSRPAHIINHWLDEMVIRVPRIIVESITIRVGGHIKTRNELNVSMKG